MLTRFTTTLIAGCALIGQAHAFEFNSEQAIRTFAVAEMADENCPGMKLNFDKVGAILRQAGIDPSTLDEKVRAVQNDWKRDIGNDREQICNVARDPTLPIHLLLDIS